MNNIDPKIYAQLNAKSNEELLAIWQENDQDAWVPETMKTVEEILSQRGVELTPAAALEAEMEMDAELTADPAKSVAVNPHSPTTILRIARIAKILSWVMLAGWGLLVPLAGLLQPEVPVAYIVASFISGIGQGALYFFLLQLVGEGIFLLVRIEQNTTRKKAE